MNSKIKNGIGSKAQARGTVLIVALVMLLIITALGINAITQSSTGLKIAKNSSQRAVSFQSAENTRMTAIQAANAAAAGFGAAAGPIPTGPAPAVDTRAFWSNAANYQAVGGSGGYVLEYLGRQSLVPDSNRANGVGGAPVDVHVFRITVHSQVNGQTDTALQMIYVTNCGGTC